MSRLLTILALALSLTLGRATPLFAAIAQQTPPAPVVDVSTPASTDSAPEPKSGDTQDDAKDEDKGPNTGDFLSGTSKEAARLSDWVVSVLSDTLGVPKGIADFLAKIVVFCLILFIFRLLGGILASFVNAALQKSKLKPTQLLLDFITGTTRNVILIFGVIMAVGVFGVDVAPLLAGIGVVGFIVGFALQETLGNFAAGIMILLYRPYDVGQFVTAGGVTGTVKAMSLISTTINTPDNQIQIVPNGSIWGNVITNVTANPTRRIDLVAGVHYRDDVDQAQAVLERIVLNNARVLKDPVPVVRIDNLGESSVDFVVRPWVKTEDYWTVRSEIIRSIKLELEKAGLSIPFPQRDIHLHKVD